MRNLLIFGGTFDPIHHGHLYTAINVQKHFHFQRFIFLPCKIPLLKTKAIATPEQRLDMLNLAINQYPDFNFEIDTSEIARASPSYMVTTLTDYRQKLGEDIAISLLMGADTFKQLHQWYQWEKLLSLTNILVIDRPHCDLNTTSSLLINLLVNHETNDGMEICRKPCGIIYRFNAGLFDLSSTLIRKELEVNTGINSKFNSNFNINTQVPRAVSDYIKDNKLYQSVGES